MELTVIREETQALESPTMETTQPIIRPEIQAFIGACETLARFAQQNGFTENERIIVVNNFVRTLERHIVPEPPID